MNLWSQSRSELKDLPGIQANSDGTIDFSVTDEEQREVDSFFKLLEDYRFHPEIAPIIPKAGTAFALCRFAIGLVINLPDPDTEAEYRAVAAEIQDGIFRALAAVYKALSIYPTPIFTHHLISFNEMAGRKSESARLRELKREQDSEWKPTQLDSLFVSWLEESYPNVRNA